MTERETGHIAGPEQRHCRLVRRAAWVLRRLHYLLFLHRRFNRLVVEKIRQQPILVLPDVFNPRLFLTGELLAGQIEGGLIPADARVLDLGTGSGIGAVFAARHGATVVAVDINPLAVKCARANAILNGVENDVDVREGDLFGPVAGQTFDIVLFNPPYFRGEAGPGIEQALFFENTHERFADGLGSHLAPRGSAILILSTVGSCAQYVQALSEAGFVLEVILEKDMICEVIVIYRARRAT